MSSFLKLIKKTAKEKPLDVQSVIPPLEAGKYLASLPRLRQTMGVSGQDKKKPGAVWGNLEFILKVDDPKLKEANIPVRDVIASLQSANIEDAARGYTYEWGKNEAEEDFVLGLCPNGNPRLWGVLGNIFETLGLATAKDPKRLAFNFPEEGEIEMALRESPAYLAAGEALILEGGDNPVDSKGKVVSEAKLWPLLMVQLQIEGLSALLKKYDEEHSFEFIVELAVTYSDYLKGDENTVKGVWFLHNGEERQIF